MRRVKLALALGLTGVAIAIGLALMHAPMTVARTNRIADQPEEPIASSRESASYCQSGETLPRGTSALRIWLDAVYGPRVAVEVTADGHAVTGGERESGWVGGSVTIPVKPLSRDVAAATVCVSFPLLDETVIVQGNATPATVATREDGQPLAGRMWIEYLRSGGRSWASLVTSTARRMGLGRAAPGIWVALAALALLAAIVTLASRLLLEELP
jgi:hypothetical protein